MKVLFFVVFLVVWVTRVSTQTNNSKKLISSTFEGDDVLKEQLQHRWDRAQEKLYIGNFASSRNIPGFLWKPTNFAILGSVNVWLFVTHYPLALVIFTYSFVEFWLITGSFDWFVLLILLLAYFAVLVISRILLELVGLNDKHLQSKIVVLTTLFSFHLGASRPLLMGGIQLLVAASLVASFGGIFGVYTFTERGDIEAQAWLAFLVFPAMAIVQYVFIAVISWPQYVSSYLDDDVRNGALIRDFVSVLYIVILLSIPFYILDASQNSILGITNPIVWVMLTIPLMVFAVVSLLPYVTGTIKHKRFLEESYDNRIRWLSSVRAIAASPEEENFRDDLRQQLSDEITVEINRWNASDFEYTQFANISELLNSAENTELGEEDRHLPELPDEVQLEDVHAMADQEESEEEIRIENPVVNRITARAPGAELLMSQLKDSQREQLEQLDQYMKKYWDSLVRWDMRLQQIKFIEQIQKLYKMDFPDTSKFLELQIGEEQRKKDTISNGRNILAVFGTASASAVIVALLSTFGSDLGDQISGLVS